MTLATVPVALFANPDHVVYRFATDPASLNRAPFVAIMNSVSCLSVWVFFFVGVKFYLDLTVSGSHPKRDT